MIGKTLLKRYYIESLIGSGGMAVVYKAQDLRAHRTVAVKVLREEFNKDQEFLRRFDREAMACAKVQHPHIVNLLDIGEDGDTRFLVMEYVEGSTLKDLIHEYGKIPAREALRLVLQALAALGHAHQKRIVHRDIKPQNILVDLQGQVKITDFGIARMTDSATVTVNDGNIMGSVHYFSPEQAQGHAVGEASDLYSMGIVLYEMLTGRVPFDGDTPVSVAMQHVNELPKPVSTYAQDVSPAVEQVLTKAMCKSLLQRYTSAEQMYDDLRRAIRQPEGGFVKMRPAPAQTTRNHMVNASYSSGKSRVRSRWRGRILFVLTLLLGTAALGVIVFTGYQFWLRMTNYQPMPSVVGLEESVAISAIEKASLEPMVLRQHSDVVMEGFVISQDPAPGNELERGKEGLIYVSLGSGQVRVPDLMTLTQEEAEAKLYGMGLTEGDVVMVISEAPVGTVCFQVPVAGEDAVDGMSVDFHISGGMVIIPDFSGIPLVQAEQEMQKLGLEMGVIRYVDVDNPKQATLIQAQSPQIAEQVFPGASVDLSVGRYDKRPFTKEVTVQVNIPVNGAHVRVTLVEMDGSESEQYAAMHTLAGENIITVPLRSAISGTMMYRLYVDNQMIAEKEIEIL